MEANQMTTALRILVVEDQPLLLLDLADQLTEYGHHVLTAGSARTAARLLDNNIDALITDIELGDGPDGLALARLAAPTQSAHRRCLRRSAPHACADARRRCLSAQALPGQRHSGCARYPAGRPRRLTFGGKTVTGLCQPGAKLRA